MNHLLEGTVTDDNGDPVRGIEVRHEGCDCNSRLVKPVRTNASGTYSISIQTQGNRVVPHTLNFYRNDNRVGTLTSPGDPPVEPGQPPPPPEVIPHSTMGGYRKSNLDLIIPAPPPQPEPQDPPADGDQNGSGTEDINKTSHPCGSKCRTKEGLCSRLTCNDGYCWQHV